MSTGAASFTATAVDALAQWQRANMPDRAFIFARVVSHGPGGVAVERLTFLRVDACRVSMSRAVERDTGGALATGRTWVLARPGDAAPLDGTERVVTIGRTGAVLVLRVVAEAGARTFQTVRKADVSTDGVAPLVLATTRAVGPVALRFTFAGQVNN